MVSGIAAALLLTLTAGQDYALPPPTFNGDDDETDMVLRPNRPARRLALYAGGGALQRFTPDPLTGYALLEVPLPAGAPVLLLLSHMTGATIRARLLDAPPWAEPRVAQPVAFEPRWDFDGSGRLIEGAWIVLPPGSGARSVFLLVDVPTGSDGGWPVSAELYDPAYPTPFNSLARRWSARPKAAYFASPLERRRQQGAQQIWSAGG